MYGISGTINPSLTTSWRVLSKNSDGTIDLIASDVSSNLTFGSSNENATYSYYEKALEEISNSYKVSTYVSNTRIPKASDYNAIKNAGLLNSSKYVINNKHSESRSYTGNQEGGANYWYYIDYLSGSTIQSFTIWTKYAGTGGQSSTSYSINIGVRPIITIKANIYEDGGSGTSSSPWKMTT